MSEENNKVEKKELAGNNQPVSNQNDTMTAVWNFLNQPAIANAGLGLILNWVIDPRGMKQTLETIEKSIEKLNEKIEDQHKEIQAIKKQVSRLAHNLSVDEQESGEDDDPDELEGTRSKRKNKRFGSAYLD